MFVRVAIPIPSAKAFTYAVPEPFVPAVAVGKRVLVPFGRRRVTGFIIEIMPEATLRSDRQRNSDLPDPEPLFDRDDLAFYEWISRYYLHPLGKVLGELLPGGIDVKSDRWLRLATGAATCNHRFSPGQQRIMDQVVSLPEGIPLSRLRRAMTKNDLSEISVFSKRRDSSSRRYA